ncbi:hypothetical protein DM02DRAFT_427127 [Periconia macrospinosa]|uniref:Uncharacterized protein n=1 Tax=Periconia macrospinosa TaxID=97972 RepID=A0A2V1E7S1_9PLEO|nr:hypothetical protein DM02DRAFT_427127 [Periconia macrospinosa]
MRDAWVIPRILAWECFRMVVTSNRTCSVISVTARIIGTQYYRIFLSAHPAPKYLTNVMIALSMPKYSRSFAMNGFLGCALRPSGRVRIIQGISPSSPKSTLVLMVAVLKITRRFSILMQCTALPVVVGSAPLDNTAYSYSKLMVIVCYPKLLATRWQTI